MKEVIALVNSLTIMYGSFVLTYHYFFVSLTEALLAKKNVSLFLSEVRGHAPLKLNYQQIQVLARHFKQRVRP